MWLSAGWRPSRPWPPSSPARCRPTRSARTRRPASGYPRPTTSPSWIGSRRRHAAAPDARYRSRAMGVNGDTEAPVVLAYRPRGEALTAIREVFAKDRIGIVILPDHPAEAHGGALRAARAVMT